MKPFWQAFLAAELAPAKAFKVLSSLEAFTAEAILASPLLTANEKSLVQSIRNNPIPEDADVLAFDQYPPTISTVPLKPAALFYDGKIECLNQPCVSIVGTRGASPYGKACARKFAETLAKSGITVISGGALGIDAAAHEGAMEAGGKTVAVLGTGIDQIFPASHRGLFERIKQQGTLISQFACGSRNYGAKFLMRNDVIAALSNAVIVIEAPLKSGALRTAHTAMELNREVLVIPGGIDRATFIGSHDLIRDGATLVWKPEHVLEHLGIDSSKLQASLDFSGTDNPILKLLSTDPLSAEKLVELSGLSASEVLSELTMLELDNAIRKESGGYIKTL